MSGRRHGRCARPLRVLGTCLSSGTLARDSVHLVPGVSHQRGSTSRVALYLELGDGLGGGRGGLRSHAQNAHLVHAAGPRSARSRALSPLFLRVVHGLATTSSKGRRSARPWCCASSFKMVGMLRRRARAEKPTSSPQRKAESHSHRSRRPPGGMVVDVRAQRPCSGRDERELS